MSSKKYMCNKNSVFYIIDNNTGLVVYEGENLIQIHNKLHELGILTNQEILNIKKYGYFELFEFWRNFKNEKYEVDIWRINFEKYALLEEQPLNL